MKIHFTASVSAKDKLMQEYVNIIDYLKANGHEIANDSFLDRSENDIHESSRDEVLEFHSQIETWIKNCDFMIADTSFPSVSVGYEISLALRLGKPVLVFYGNGGAPSLLSHYKNERLLTERYTEDTYKETIDSFINFVEGNSDQRFTFFITPEISAFLDEIVLKEKTPKSVYIRKLIEEDMKKRKSI